MARIQKAVLNTPEKTTAQNIYLNPSPNSTTTPFLDFI